MSHFYLTLPSNSSAKYYDNTLTHFTTKLLSSVSLSGAWEVGLSEIIFPRSWHTLERHEAVFYVTCTTLWLNPNSQTGTIQLKGPEEKELYRIEVRIPHGYYESIHDLHREMNKSLSKILPYETLPQKAKDENLMPRLKFNETSRKMNFVMFKGQSLSFSAGLASLLGVGSKQNPSKANYEDSFGWTSTGVCDITRGLNYLMIYCDLLEHVPVGDTKAPLLRIVDATGSNCSIIHRTFEEVRYVPLQKRNFDSIEIDIRDDYGNPISFENGKLLVALHFRQTKNPYYLG